MSSATLDPSKPPPTPQHEKPVVELPRKERLQVAGMSQWQLIRLRFMRHRLAVVSLYMLVFLYALALVCEFVAPYRPNTRNLDYLYSPPNSLHFNLERGIHTYVLEQAVDPVTFRKSYRELRDQPVELSWFARGPEYELWGLIPMQRHLFGVDANAWRAHSEQASTSTQQALPPFFLLGADKYGRDIFSRAVYGARISLSVGLIGILGTFILGMTIGGISGYVGGRTDQLDGRERERFFREELMRHSLQAPAARFLRGEFEPELAAASMHDFLKGKPAFDAVVVADYLMAIAVSEVLREAGLRVPEDVSVVAFGDGPEAAAAGLTVVGADVVEDQRAGRCGLDSEVRRLRRVGALGTMRMLGCHDGSSGPGTST